jgi:hypothetical protein
MKEMWQISQQRDQHLPDPSASIVRAEWGPAIARAHLRIDGQK